MSTLYNEYLVEHKENVAKGFKWLVDNLPDVIRENNTDFIYWKIVYQHDLSKTQKDEYDAYDAYFYGKNKSYEITQAFNEAWLLHIHRNPHHWQYWVLMHDEQPDEGTECIEIPGNYIIEMICDWWSFSWKHENLDFIFQWYDEHKDYIQLNDKSREKIEMILSKIKAKLDEKETNNAQT